MLERMLELIRSGGTFEVHALARQLSTTPGLVRMMLKQLEQMDKVKANLNCEGGCGQCGLKSSCKVVKKEKPNSNSWVMTEPSS